MTLGVGARVFVTRQFGRFARAERMEDDQLREAVAIRDRFAPSVLLEASGGVNLETIREIAATGVDRISIGALTHSAPALDVSFDWGR